MIVVVGIGADGLSRLGAVGSRRIGKGDSRVRIGSSA